MTEGKVAACILFGLFTVLGAPIITYNVREVLVNQARVRADVFKTCIEKHTVFDCRKAGVNFP